VIAAGTGLGESALVWDMNRYHAIASEGAHRFRAACEEQIELLRFLEAQFGHASYERAVRPGSRTSIASCARAVRSRNLRG